MAQSKQGAGVSRYYLCFRVADHDSIESGIRGMGPVKKMKLHWQHMLIMRLQMLIARQQMLIMRQLMLIVWHGMLIERQ